MDLKQLLTQTTIKPKEDIDAKLVDDIPLKSEKENEFTKVEDNLEPSALDKVEQDTRFQQPWNKLEKGMKMNRILLFVQTETDKHNLSPMLSKDLKYLLFKGNCYYKWI